MSQIHILLRNDHIKHAVLKLLKDDIDNKEDIALFMESLIANSTPAVSTFFSLFCGDSLIKLPDVGTLGYVSCENLGYGIKKEDFLKSDLCRQGYIPVEVVRLRTYSDYTPIVVKLPLLPSQTSNQETSVEIANFHVGDITSIDLDNLK